MRKLPDSFTGDARHFILPLNVLEVFIRSDIWFSVGVIVAEWCPRVIPRRLPEPDGSGIHFIGGSTLILIQAVLYWQRIQ